MTSDLHEPASETVYEHELATMVFCRVSGNSKQGRRSGAQNAENPMLAGCGPTTPDR